MPFARRAADSVVAWMWSAKSIVTTTCERAAGSVTNGMATGDLSAQLYRMPEEAAVRSVVQTMPPWPSIQSTWSASSTSVASAGVL